MPNLDHKSNRSDRGQKLTDSDGWVDIPRDVEWQDATEDLPKPDSGHLAANDDTDLKSISVTSLFKEFFFKMMNTT